MGATSTTLTTLVEPAKSAETFADWVFNEHPYLPHSARDLVLVSYLNGLSTGFDVGRQDAIAQDAGRMMETLAGHLAATREEIRKVTES